MRALLWKEWRENLYKVGTGLGICVLLLLLRLGDRFNASFADVVPVWANAIGCLMAGVLAMEAVAGERSRGTIDFLMARPTTPARILLPKFAVGAAGLLAVVAGFWLMAYAVPFDSSADGTHANWSVADVSLPVMVYTWYLPVLAAYAVVFLASVATDNPAEAAAAGAIGGMGCLFAYFTVTEFVPELGGWRLPERMLDLSLESSGRAVRTANSMSLQVIRTAMTAAVVTAALGGAVLLFGRHRQYSIQRRTLVIAGFVLVALLLILPPLFPEHHASRSPVAEVALEARGVDLLPVPGASPGTFAVVHGHGLQVLATPPPLALVGPRSPVAVGELRVPEGGVQVGAVAAGRLWLGRAPAGSESGAEIIGVSVDRPGEPEVLASTPVACPGGVDLLVALVPFSGEALALVSSGADGVLVTALEAQADGAARVVAQLAVPDAPPVDTGPWTVALDRPAGCGVAVREGYLYLGLSTELVTVDGRDPGRLAEAGQVRLEAENRYRPHGPRHLAVHGDQLHVERKWPRELVVLDLDDPAIPRPVGSLHPRSPLMGAQPLDGLVYRPLYEYGGGSLEVRAAADLEARPIWRFCVQGEQQVGRGLAGQPLLFDGHLVAVMGSRLAVFHLPEPLLPASPSAPQ